jgi:lipoprotein-anchoring transpeptidase ErfK/SrfK
VKYPIHTALAVSLVLGIFVLFNPPTIKEVFVKGVKVGQVNLSQKPIDEGIKNMHTAYKQPIYLNVNNKSFSTSLYELGYSINTSYLKSKTMKCIHFVKLHCYTNKTVQFDQKNALTFNDEKSKKFLTSLNDKLVNTKHEPIVDFFNYEFWIRSNAAEIKIDPNFAHSTDIYDKFGNSISLKVRVIEKDNEEAQKNLMYEHVSKVNSPLLIKYGRNPLYIPTEKISNFITQTQVDEMLQARISKQEISKYLDELAREYESEDVLVIRPEAEDAIVLALLYKAVDTKANTAVVLPLQGKPKSNGEHADEYLEVVKSQQRLYRFENGELVKTYIISTGILAETPAGEFKVLGKQKKTISYVGNWWMENYLPIGTMPGTSNRFGFHAIPYHQYANGEIWSRDPNTMGSPATSGCIQLTQEESLELFEWAKVGMPVFIYD